MATKQKMKLKPINLTHFKAVLFDMDGTLFTGSKVLPGAALLPDHLKSIGVRCAVVSNSGSTPVMIRNKLHRMGIHMHESEIYTSAMWLAQYIPKHFGPKCRVFNLATTGVELLLDAQPGANVRWVRSDKEKCDVVVASDSGNPQCSVPRQVIALRLLERGAALIGVSRDFVYPVTGGNSFGSAAITEMLSLCTGVQPTYSGKPELPYIRAACAHLGFRTRSCVMVGDNLESDIKGPRKAGMTTVLVTNGLHEYDDALKRPVNKRPHFVVDSLKELLHASKR